LYAFIMPDLIRHDDWLRQAAGHPNRISIKRQEENASPLVTKSDCF
jgi:hypothetical protein